MALSSQRRRFSRRGGSPSGWRRRRRAKAIRRAAGVTIVAGLTLGLLLWAPWQSDLDSGEIAAAPASNTPETATLAANDSASDQNTDLMADSDDLGAIDAAPTKPIDSIAAAPAQRPVSEPTVDDQMTPVSMTMGRPLSSGSESLRSAVDLGAAASIDEATDAPARQALDLSLQRLETTPASPRSAASRAGMTFTSPEPVRTMLDDALSAQDRADPIEARSLFNRALFDPRITPRDAEVVRERMGALNQMLLFSPTVAPNDPLTESYVIRSGDSLSRIAFRNDLGIDWRLLQRVNRISDPRRIRIGQTLKLVKGPFHAVVHKRSYRIDLFSQLPDGADGELMFIDSFRVGLGELNSTPAGSWVVRKNSRLINPPWTNPRTGEYFSADNPKNPIGERWVGLLGIDDTTQSIPGIGIHGTIEPDSIGDMRSMGCIRMLSEDVAVIYELLTEGVSRVEILP